MAVELHTPLCDLLGVTYPILSVGFIGARAELVAAVSNAGGFGVIGVSGARDAVIRSEIARTKALTDRPFGINVIIDEDPDDRDETRAFVSCQIAAAADAGAAAVVLFWGSPAPYVAAAHGAGLTVLIQVGSVAEAEDAVAAGVDVVIAQGIEAGGHVRGSTSIWELLPATVKAVHPVPVVASGGIGDGAGLARALAAGAQGVSLGTRFVASDEAYLHPEYKRRIVMSTASDTVYTEDLYDVGWPGAPHRTLRNRTFDEWVAADRPRSGERPQEGTSIGRRWLLSGKLVDWRRYEVGMATPEVGDGIEFAPLWAGESCEVINDIKPAARIVADLVRDAKAAALQERSHLGPT